MNNFFFFLSFIFFEQFVANAQTVDIVYQPNPLPRSDNRIRLITQSCNYQYYQPNNLWKYMVALEPDVITLLGDTIYLDAEPCDADEQECNSMFDLVCDVIDCDEAADISCFNYCWARTTWYENPTQQYNYLLNSTQFTLNKAYNKSSWPVPVLAIWDDHDYCRDNSNATCRYKNLTRDAFVDFLGEINQNNILTPVVNDLTENTNVGVFYYIDYNKTFDDNRILKLRFYMMDVRWYRTETEMFGEEQRSWFENVVLNDDLSDINYHIVCTGLTRYPTFGLGESLAESWPTASIEWFDNVTSLAGMRDRLIILSGDVHYSAIYQDDKVIEVVTSAMTHGIYDTQAAYLQSVQEDDGYLVTGIINDENIGIMDIGFNSFSVAYLDQSGRLIDNFTYNYTSDVVTSLAASHIGDWWTIASVWMIIGFAIGYGYV